MSHFDEILIAMLVQLKCMVIGEQKNSNFVYKILQLY